jgi:hypothetical protein
MLMRRVLTSAVVCFVLFFSHAALAQKNYWHVAGDVTRVWSLSDNQFVGVSDTGYIAWLTLPMRTTGEISSTAELYEVISSTYPDHLAVSAPVLETDGGLTPYQAFTWRRVAGLNITYTGAPWLDGKYSIDDQWLGGLMTAALLRCDGTILSSCANPFPFGSTTYVYRGMDGINHTMSITQMRVVVLAIQDFVAGLYAQLSIGLAGGTPSWPSSTVTVP